MSDPIYWYFEGKYEVPVDEPVELMVDVNGVTYWLIYSNERVNGIGWSPLPDGPKVYNKETYDWEPTPWRLFANELRRLQQYCQRQIGAAVHLEYEISRGKASAEYAAKAVDDALRRKA